MNAKEFYNQGKKFFFNDIELTAKYVQENCKEEMEHILRVANEVVRQEYKFDLRWDMEQTVEPVVFKDEIDWLYMPGDDPEFIYAFNRMRFWICLGQAYAITKDEKYAKAFASQMCHWVKNVPHNQQNEKAWRTLETGLRLEYWTKAIMYFKGSPNITDKVIDTFVYSMTEHAEFLMGVWNSYNLMSNWGVLANHGLFIAGLMLPSNSRTKEYLETAIWRLNQELAIQVYPDGTQWEQSPMYHNEVLQNYLTVIILANRNNIKLPDGFEDKVHKMALVNVIWQKPDGNEICMGDSDEIDVRDLTTTSAVIFKDPILKGSAYEHLDFDSAWEVGAEFADFYDKLEAKHFESTSQFLQNSGNFYLRSGWNQNDIFFHFHCGTLGAGHGHSDQLHIDLFANGEDILLDAGRFTYVNKAERFEFKDSTAHNTSTVDGKSVYTYVDSWECGKLDKAINRVCKDFKKYAYLEGGHLGYMTNPKGGVFANRKILYIKPDIFVICDEFYTNAKHSYQNYLHFNNSGKILQGLTGNWHFSSDKNNCEISFILSNKASLKQKIIDTRISRHYNALENNKTLVNSWSENGFSALFTIISVNNASQAKSLSVEKVDVKSNFKNIIFKDSQIEALKISKGEKSYLVVIAHEEYASPTDTFNAASCTGFGQVTVFDLAEGENSIGTMIVC